MTSRYADPASVQSVWKWVNAGSGANPAWAFYSPLLADGGKAFAASKGYQFLSSIGTGEGYWVNAKAAFVASLPFGATVQSASFKSGSGKRPLPKGWSLIATGDYLTPLAFSNTLSESLIAGTMPPYLTSLWAWDAGSSGWYFWSPLLYANSTLADYLSGKNYLDFGQIQNIPVGTMTPGTGVWVNMP